MVISGIEAHLRKMDYFFPTVAHRDDQNLLSQYSELLLQGGVEGVITVDPTVLEAPSLRMVAVAGHQKTKGVTNVVLDHVQAATLALTHLATLGHKRIAFMRGNPLSSDSTDRWRAICEVAQGMGVTMDREFA